jgi:hypothetical protein
MVLIPAGEFQMGESPEDMARLFERSEPVRSQETPRHAVSAAGVHPRTAQALARHSKLDLTMRAYTDVQLLDLRGAVEAASLGPREPLFCSSAVS